MDMRHTSLRAAFLQDHRKMTKGFYRLGQKLEAGDWTEARRIALAIDRDVGPHIEFEETVYYPRLVPVVGAANVDMMYAEHGIGLRLIQDLMSAGSTPPDSAVMADLADRCQTMLEHAQTCGTLLTHLTALPPDEQNELLARLEHIRERGRSWSELANRKQPRALDSHIN